VSCCCIVFVVRKATLRLVCLNKLVTRLISGLKCVNVIHLLRDRVSSSCCHFWLCFWVINFVLRLCIIAFTLQLLQACQKGTRMDSWEALYIQALHQQNILITEQKTNDTNPLFELARITNKTY
jgi:hypothetical protein